MPRASRPLVSFTQGEWSPLTYGRIDVDQHAKALQLCRDFVPCLQGTLTRRPGTAYVTPVKGNDTNVRYVPFIFNSAQAYVLEFTNQTIRFYTNGGQLLSGGIPYEIATPYLDTDLWGINYTQSADVMYIVHPNYPPKLLKRLGATNWTLTNQGQQDGPYLTQNIADNFAVCTVTRVGSTGTLTFDKLNGLNGGAGLTAADVGRLVRITNTNWTDVGPTTTQVSTTVGSTTTTTQTSQASNASSANPQKWIQLLITGVTSTLVAKVTVVGVVPQ